MVLSRTSKISRSGRGRGSLPDEGAAIADNDTPPLERGRMPLQRRFGMFRYRLYYEARFFAKRLVNSHAGLTSRVRSVGNRARLTMTLRFRHLRGESEFSWNNLGQTLIFRFSILARRVIYVRSRCFRRQTSACGVRGDASDFDGQGTIQCASNRFHQSDKLVRGIGSFVCVMLKNESFATAVFHALFWYFARVAASRPIDILGSALGSAMVVRYTSWNARRVSRGVSSTTLECRLF